MPFTSFGQMIQVVNRSNSRSFNPFAHLIRASGIIVGGKPLRCILRNRSTASTALFDRYPT